MAAEVRNLHHCSAAGKRREAPASEVEWCNERSGRDRQRMTHSLKSFLGVQSGKGQKPFS
jgi:hypothetical protein